MPASDRPARSTERADVRRVIVPLTEDGAIAVDRLKPGQLEQVAALANDPAVRKLLAPDTPIALPAFVGAALVNAIATLDLFLVQRVTKAPPALVQEIAAWTPEEKSAVEPAALAVANKYGGTVLSKYGEEAALVVALVSITSNKILAIRDALDRIAPRPVETPAPVTPAPDAPLAPEAVAS